MTEQQFAQWVEYFRYLGEKQGNETAKCVVTVFNDSIGKGLHTVPDSALKAFENPDLIKRLPVIPSSLSGIWSAYYQSLQPHSDKSFVFDKVELIGTVPAGLKQQVSLAGDFSGSFTSSLLSSVAEVIRGASTLCVINPFWSAGGVNNLKRYCPVADTLPDKTVIITAEHTSPEHEYGLNAFVSWMLENDKICDVYKLATDEHGRVPLVHAKAMFNDSGHGYIGSANISDNGFIYSVELGLAIQGSLVTQGLKWFDDILDYCVIKS